MAEPNFLRMIALATEVFDAKNDPEQLDVDDAVRQKLLQLHPATLSHQNNADGPVAWILLFPTTSALMQQFLKHEITERQLFDKTAPGLTYDTVYLCSALVLDEYRRQGIALNLTVNAVREIEKTHPISCLFVWPFNAAGDAGAEAIAQHLGLPLLKRR